MKPIVFECPFCGIHSVTATGVWHDGTLGSIATGEPPEPSYLEVTDYAVSVDECTECKDAVDGGNRNEELRQAAENRFLADFGDFDEWENHLPCNEPPELPQEEEGYTLDDML